MMSAQAPPRSPLEVSTLLEASALGLVLIAGNEGMGRTIASAEVQKPGLALAGHLESLHADRVQILGYSEISYLESLESGMAWTRAHELCGHHPPAVIVTRGLEIPPGLIAACTEEQIPLLRTARSTSELMDRLRAHLAACLSPTASIHGVLVDVFGIGILLLGKSGIGKSELALDLVMRGHRLVADDIVELRREAGRALFGAGPEIIKHHMEIRGLGILNIKDLFGIAAVRDAKRVELVVELVEWNEEEEYDRLGVDEQAYEVLGVAIPLVRLPVRPGRNMTSIIEVAARNQLLKVQGHHSAREFQDRLVRAIASSHAPRELAPDSEVE
jgi:HPr kinase/phosphorylase